MNLSCRDLSVIRIAVARGYAVPVRCDSVANLMKRAKAEAMAQAGLLRVSRTTEAEIVYLATENGHSLV